MHNQLRSIASAALLLAAIATPTLAEDWSLVGSWSIKVTGSKCAGAQIVSIDTATATKVRGTTAVGSNYGKIVSGTFDGKKATMVVTFVWEGKQQAEDWALTMSRNGNYIKGNYKNRDGVTPGCKFSGPRQ